MEDWGWSIAAQRTRDVMAVIEMRMFWAIQNPKAAPQTKI
jgi:hypothetical protein